MKNTNEKMMPVEVVLFGGEEMVILPGGGFHGGEQTETLPGGGFLGFYQCKLE